MNYLRVHKWDHWQTYRKDRGLPPWIKVHRCLMRKSRWVALSDAQRGQLVAMWLLAADRNGFIPDDAGEVKKLCYMRSRPDLEWWIRNGWLQRDANVTPTWRQRDAPEERRVDTEAEAEESARPDFKFGDDRAFVPPTVEQVREYAGTLNYRVDPEDFWDYYDARGWMGGKVPIRNWQSAFRKWARQEAKWAAERGRSKKHGSNKPNLDGLGEGDAGALPFR